MGVSPVPTLAPTGMSRLSGAVISRPNRSGIVRVASSVHAQRDGNPDVQAAQEGDQHEQVGEMGQSSR